MDKYPYEVMGKLDSILEETDRVAWLFSKTPERDFSRHRKLPFHRLAKVLIGMEGNSLSHEMLNCFHFSQDTPTVSALVQQRAKLLPEAMAFVFSEVGKAFPCRETFDGYRLIACDGSDLHDPANPLETDTSFQTDDNARGYNFLHLNVLYDVCSKRYTDAILQPGRCADEVGAFVTMIDRFPANEKTIFTADRGYESYNVMAHIIEKGMRFLIRVKNPRSNGTLCRFRLPENAAFDCELVASHAALLKRSNSLVYQLNFSAAVHIIRRVLFLPPDESPPDVVSLIRSFLLPVRPNRSAPRKVKCRSAIPFPYRIA